MRWYCVLCFCASLLKNSTLRLLSAIVTLTPSSRTTAVFRARKEIRNDLEVSEGFVRVPNFLAHRFAFPCANSQLRISGRSRRGR